ncbi:MAG TPA: hypothetical protein VN289_23830 [Paraburkholderia sp.]|jgi:hypothetical protein|nr:hypothetical protein [Paraburkholderia sp.]
MNRRLIDDSYATFVGMCGLGVLGLIGGIRVFVSVLHALPLCGAALTFFAAAKKVSEGLNSPFSALNIQVARSV